MNILLLWAGIADPLKPLPTTTDADTLARHAAQHNLPSPFDEAALEVALKLRDRDPQTHIAAWCAGGEALARRLAAYPVEPPCHIDGLPGAWDGAARVAAIAALRPQLPFAPDLVLMGREFGDWDDGSAPALLAQAWQLRYLSLATAIAADGAELLLTRQRGALLEQLRLAGPLLASVTNAPSNRLRHPLLKNVMLAKKLVPATLAAAEPAAPGRLALAALRRHEAAARSSACEMLGGGPAQQAEVLAQRLLALIGP